MKNPEISAATRVSVMYQLRLWIMRLSGSSNSIKNAGLRRFLFSAFLLMLWMPAPASAETACEVGAFLDVGTGQCYSCPAGYSHNPLLPANVSGVCSTIANKTTATRQGDSSFLCPAGQFPNFATGRCHSCPSGYTDNLDGTCTQSSNITATYNSPFRTCTGGTFDGLNGSCYSCPSGYSRIGLSTSCTRTVKSNSTMSSCGSRTWNPNVILGIDFGYWSYTGCGALITSAVRSGNSYYKCSSGYSHDIAVPFNNNGICFKYTTSNVNATYNYAIGCASGTFDGLNGSCYSCPSGYNHNSALTVGTPGVCWKQSTVAQTQHDNIGFLCPGGQFLDVATNDCFTCPSGYEQDIALSANTVGVCYQVLNTTASYVPAKTAGQACVGLFQGNCAASLICDGGSGLCRNDPPELGQACGLSVPCADPYTCYAGACKERGISREACDAFVANSCEDDLVCDILGECRSAPPTVGEICGLSVPCSSTPADAAPNPVVPASWDNANGSLACLTGRCVVKGGPKDACDSLVPNSCADDLECVLGECQHARPLRGERCHQLTSPCATQHPHDIDTATGQPKVLDLACHSDLYFAQPRCDTPRETGEICSGLGQGSCRPGNLCALTYNEKVQPEVAFRCTPKLELFGNFNVEQCKSFYNKTTAGNVNSGTLALAFGYGSSASAGVSGSIETGVVYGPPVDENGQLLLATDGSVRDPNGEFGCYQTACLGVNASAGVDDSACIAYDRKFPDDGEQTLEFFSEFDIADAVTGGTSPISVGISVASVFESTGSDPLPDGASYCLFVGAGVGLPVGNAGGETCTTEVMKVDISSFWDTSGGSTGGSTDTTCTETVSIRPKSGKLQLVWDPVDAAVSYDIERSTVAADSGFGPIASGHVTGYATYLDTGLANGTTYWYRVIPKDNLDAGLCTTSTVSGIPVAATRSRR